MIVVDASFLATALADDRPDGDLARRRLAGESLVAPALVDLEVLSVIRKALRRGLLDRRRADQAIADLRDLPLRRVQHTALIERAWALRDNATPYDAAYLALAETLGVPLITADARLAAVPGTTCTVETLGPGAAPAGDEPVD